MSASYGGWRSHRPASTTTTEEPGKAIQLGSSPYLTLSRATSLSRDLQSVSHHRARSCSRRLRKRRTVSLNWKAKPSEGEIFRSEIMPIKSADTAPPEQK